MFYANLKGVAKDTVASHVSRSSYEDIFFKINKFMIFHLLPVVCNF